jgi:hypothetical protein
MAVVNFFQVAEKKDGSLQIQVDPKSFTKLKGEFSNWDKERTQLQELNKQYLGYQEDRKAFQDDMAKIQNVLTDYQSQTTKIYNLIKSIQEVPLEQLPVISANPPIKDTQQWLAQYFSLKPTEKKSMLNNATAFEKQLIQNVEALHDEYVEQFKDNQMLLMFDEKYGGDVVDEIIDEYETTAAGTNLGSENYAAIWRQARNFNNAKILYASRVAEAKNNGATFAPNGAVPKSEVLKALGKTPNTEEYLSMLVNNLTKTKGK